MHCSKLLSLAVPIKELAVWPHLTTNVSSSPSLIWDIWTWSYWCFSWWLLISILFWLLRFPNLAVGALTRDSVQAAVSNGITAEQILHYLRTHAHPEMLSRVRLMSENFIIDPNGSEPSETPLKKLSNFLGGYWRPETTVAYNSSGLRSTVIKFTYDASLVSLPEIYYNV